MKLWSQGIPVRQLWPPCRRGLIAGSVAVLLTLALVYTVGYPLSLTWDLSRYFAFGQLHSLVFVGNALLLMVTLSAMAKRPAIPRRFRVAGAMLVLAHAFTVLTAVMWVPAYTDTRDVLHAGMLTYVLILLLGNFSLMTTVPWWRWPRVQLLRLIADTLLVMSVIDIALTVALPMLIPGWRWTPALTAAVFRLETSLGLSFWYGTVYRRFGGFQHHAVVPWAVGVGCLLATDVTLLWGTLQMEWGRSDLLLGAGMPFWMVHQTMWSLGLTHVLDEVPAWRSTLRVTPYRGPLLRWALSLRQGLVLAGLAVVVGSAGSLRATAWFVAALLMSQIVGAYELGAEREELERANTRLRDLGAQQGQMLEQRQLRAAEVAHDMGNLLQDVKLTTAVINTRLRARGDAIPLEIQELLRSTDTSVDAIDGLLNAMVAAAKLDAGRLQLVLTPADLQTILQGVSRALHAQANDQRIALAVRIPPELPLVWCDANLLRRALLNIVGNAIKFTGAAREIGGRVDVAVTTDGDFIAITVADNGPGIASADLERLGQPFVRGADTPQAPAGFGLGLAFAHGVIEQHPGGALALRSAPGQGTVVTVRLQHVERETNSRAVGKHNSKEPF